MQTITLSISGMHCQNCAGRIQQALAALPGVHAAAVDLAGNNARVGIDESACRTADLVAAVQHAGYQITGFKSEPAHE